MESGKWINVQHHVRHNSKLTSNQFVSSQRKKQTTKSPNINDITNPFPNPETFSQSLDVSKLDNLKKAAENFKLNMCKSAEVALSSSKEVELWMLQLTRPLGIESNQGLVQILLQETIEYWNPSVLSTLNISNKNESSPSGHKMEVEVSHTHKE